MANLRILLVEDDPDGQEVMGRIMQYHNLSADIAKSGEEALDLLATGTYSGAVIDLNLPNIDGWGLLSAIRSEPSTANMPCVAITAFHSAEVAVKAIEAGFTAYFPKPLEPGSFVKDLLQYVS